MNKPQGNYQDLTVMIRASWNLLALAIALGATVVSNLAQANPEIPGKLQERPIALVGATVHPVSGAPIEKGVVLFDGGKIVAIGAEVAIPEKAVKIDVAGKHVYPGLINADGDLGLVEINSVRASIDTSETGQINPNVKAQVAFNPDSEIVPVTRANGILLSLASPAGGLITGQSALIQLDGWTYEDMTLRAPIGMHISWPRVGPGRARSSARGDRVSDGAGNQGMETLKRAIADARAYRQAQQAATSDAGTQVKDVRWEALIPVLEGKLPIIVGADSLSDIQAAVAWSAAEKLKLIILGGYDAPLCTELLKQHNVPVIVAACQRLPQRESDPYDAAFTVPERLRQAGVKFCISSPYSATAIRNLPYQAGAAAAHGLPRDEALRAITLYPAEILGVDDRVGSLDAGKDATLIVTSGDPIETSTQVEQAFIQGRQVDLNDRHKRLWNKYQEKYRRLPESKP